MLAPIGISRSRSPVQRTPLAVSAMEKPTGHTRATSWQPPWLQDRSQPYSPHVPGGSGTRTRCPQGTQATPGPPASHPAPWIRQGWGQCRGEVTGSRGHLHPLGFVAWRGKRVEHGAHEFMAISIPWDSWRGQGRAPGIATSPGTWAGDSLLSIRAHAKVGSDAGTTTTAEGAERCGNGNRSSGNGNRTPSGPPEPHTHVGCTSRCPGTASSQDNIRCRSLGSRRGAPRGACGTPEPEATLS